MKLFQNDIWLDGLHHILHTHITMGWSATWWGVRTAQVKKYVPLNYGGSWGEGPCFRSFFLNLLHWCAPMPPAIHGCDSGKCSQYYIDFSEIHQWHAHPHRSTISGPKQSTWVTFGGHYYPKRKKNTKMIWILWRCLICCQKIFIMSYEIFFGPKKKFFFKSWLISRVTI